MPSRPAQIVLRGMKIKRIISEVIVIVTEVEVEVESGEEERDEVTEEITDFTHTEIKATRVTLMQKKQVRALLRSQTRIS